MAYIDKYGVEYSEDKKTLVKCPKDFQGAYSILEGVTMIGYGAFAGCSGLTSVTIPNSVILIDYKAFISCSGLTSIEIPNSITTIGLFAFYNCSGLTSINVDTANIHYTSVDGVLFDYAKTVLLHFPIGNLRKEYTIPNSVTRIGDDAFSGCSGLTSVTIPNSVTEIGERAFSGCRGLTSIEIPNSVTRIRYEAFRTVNNIIYNGIATFTDYDDEDWSALCKNGYVNEHLVYRDATKTTLCGCSSAFVGSIQIPNSVTKIMGCAFSGCSGLTSIEIPNSVTRIIGSAFSGCSGLTSIEIPNSVTRIESETFKGCTSLVSIEIPNSVTEIWGSAFKGCSGLTSVTIPNSVTTIGVSAFSGCSGLKHLIVLKGQKERFAQMSTLAEVKDKIIEKDSEKEEQRTILLSLAKAYEKGIGVKQDMGQAFMFYKQAAEVGDEEAQQWMKEREQQERQIREFMGENQKDSLPQPYYLFIDTETTGLPQYYSAPVSDGDNWPRMVQLAWIATDAQGNEVKHGSHIIRPEGFVIPSDATAVHSISTNRAEQEGESLSAVLQEFAAVLAQADTIVGHNIDFDQHIIGAELYRKNMNYAEIMDKHCICTMLSSTNFCAIPNPHGYEDYKWPKLQELYYKLFNRNFEEAHDAMADIIATKDCFFELKKRGII